MLTREVVAPPRSLTRPTLAALVGCALFLLCSQRCAREVRTKLDRAVQMGATIGPAPARMDAR